MRGVFLLTLLGTVWHPCRTVNAPWHTWGHEVPGFGWVTFRWRAATLTPLSRLYSTGPCCPVLAISRHTCMDPDLGPRPARLIRFTLYKVGRWPAYISSCPTFLHLNPHYNRPLGHWPCVKSCLVEGRDKYLVFSLTVQRTVWHPCWKVNTPWHTWGRKAPGFGCVTFRWLSCNIDTFVPLV